MLWVLSGFVYIANVILYLCDDDSFIRTDICTSAIVVFFKDLGQIINIILQIGVWMTPIMWNIDGMELNPILITILKLNPMYYIVAGYRDSLINKAGFWEQPGMTIYYWILTIVLFIIGTKIFKKLKPHFADVL